MTSIQLFGVDGVAYEAATFTATWQLDPSHMALGIDKQVLDLDADAAGVTGVDTALRLDGEHLPQNSADLPPGKRSNTMKNHVKLGNQVFERQFDLDGSAWRRRAVDNLTKAGSALSSKCVLVCVTALVVVLLLATSL